MPATIVIGAQWGDEGKGKIVDWLSERADVVVRFQGGHNAGHTIVCGNQTYKLSLLPSGVVRGKLSIIGNGVVVDPWALLREIETVRAQGLNITPETLRVADNAVLILPLHQRIDQAREEAKGARKIGTTGRGIGPAYEDKVGRRAIRVCDLAEPATLAEKVDDLVAHHNAFLRGLGVEEIDAAELLAALREIAPKLLPYAHSVWRHLEEARKQGKRVLLEGAQGTMLDIDHGTYPYVTSSNTTTGGALAGTGVGADSIDYVLGIAKAYATRVGGGPFPTELHDAMGEEIRKRGQEFGATTGRPRRCGWIDIVALKRAVAINGISGLCVTKLDVLDGIGSLKMCIAYRYHGKETEYPPLDAAGWDECEPVYLEFPGWTESTHNVKEWDKLPPAARAYLRALEELVGCPLAMVSTGPDRDANIILQDPYA